MIWDAALVKSAFVHAFECDFDIGGRWKPKGFGMAMPATIDDEAARWWESDSLLDEDKQPRARRRRSPSDISHMEIVLLGFTGADGKHHPNWVMLLVDMIGPRNCLLAHAVETAKSNIRGGRFDAKGFCKRKGWNYYTYRYRRDAAADFLAGYLNRSGVPAW